MKRENPRRIAIIGLPGSGKSTFAIKLGKVLNLPVHHLDRHIFEGKKKIDKQGFIAMKQSLLKEDSWIIEGCSFSTLEIRFARADTVIYLNFPRWICLWRIFKRLFIFDRDNTGCLRGINWPLIHYIWNFDREKGPAIKELSVRYPNVDLRIFHCSKELDNYLKKVR